MNLILFDSAAQAERLERGDPRYLHVRDVLKMGVGDAFFVGVRNGRRGKATITAHDETGMRLRVEWESAAEERLPLIALLGLPRPQTARDLLREGATLGVDELWFFRPEKGEPSYAESRLWTSGEWQTQLTRGAEQAFATSIPTVRHFESLQAAIAALPPAHARVALDIYEATSPYAQCVRNFGATALALGSERGWSANERDILRANGFAMASLGARVLREETALIAAVSVWQALRQPAPPAQGA